MGIVKALSTDAQDTLMKYLYKGMALPGWGDVSGSVLLGWHEKVRRTILLSELPCLPFAVDGGSGYRVHRARHDRQKNRMMNLKHWMYNTCGMLSRTSLVSPPFWSFHVVCNHPDEPWTSSALDLLSHTGLDPHPRRTGVMSQSRKLRTPGPSFLGGYEGRGPHEKRSGVSACFDASRLAVMR